MSVIHLSEGWDHRFLYAGSLFAEPLCLAFELLRYRLVAPLDPGKFDNASTKTREIGRRVLIALGALAACTTAIGFTVSAALSLGVASKVCRAIGFALQTKGFTHIRTGAPEKSLENLPKIATWNICGIAGGMQYDHGGLIGWRGRLEGIVEKIREEEPDVLVFQEIYDTSLAQSLLEKLGGEYAHVYAHMGQSLFGSVGGLMVFSKCAVSSFTNEDFNNSSWQLKRGFATIEVKRRPEDPLPCARVIGTHLIHANPAARMEQVAQIVSSVAQRTLPLPTVIVGDLNIERQEGLLDPYMNHGYLEEAPTCTNQLTAQWDPSLPVHPEETIDYISLFKRSVPGFILPGVKENFTLENCHRIEAFRDTSDPDKALSDHHGLVAQLVEVP